jgi:Transglycosylase SLT domain
MGRRGAFLLRNGMTICAALAGVFAVLIPPALADPVGLSFPDLPSPPAVSGLIGMPQVYVKGRRQHLDLVRREAERRRLPPDVADAVAQVESAYNPKAVGDVGEIGLMQVRPGTAHMLGHRGSVEALFEPETNIRFGVAYLSRAWELSGGNLCRALMKYRAGHGEERMTALSVEYCRRARIHLASIGSPLAGAPLPAASVLKGSSSRTSKVSIGSPLASGRLPAGFASKASAWHTSKVARQTRSRVAWAALGACAETMPSATMPGPGASRAARETRSREIWAAHEARMLAIQERLLARRPLVPACM